MTAARAFMDRRVPVAPAPVPEDPVLPHLAEALDPVAMLALFRGELTPAGEFGIEDCRVDRIRYRRGARAIIQYTVRLVAPSGGELREQWITALLYPRERAGQVWGKLQRRVPPIAVPDAVLPPVAFAQDSTMILQTFPVDRRLPSLPALVNPGQLAFALAQPGGAAPGAWTVEAVRYRAGLGCALRWHLDARSNGSDTWYVKAYRDRQGARSHRALLALGSALGGLGFTVPEPVAYLEDHRALVQEEVTGRSLADVLLAKDDAGPVMGRVAEALATFHREVPAPARRRTKSDELDDVRRAAALVSWVRPALTDTAQSVVACIAEGLDDVEPAATHGDLKPDHIVLRGDSLTVLDLDWFSGSDPVADVGAMIARLTGLAHRHPPLAARIEAVGRTFADGYFARVPSAWQRRFPAHHAGALLHEAGGCFRHQLPGWPELMDAIVQRAMEVLSH
jgi:aminoglycoside phosphotransferase (APT) family kinase protein